VLPFGRLWYDAPDNAIGYAMYSILSYDAVICVYDEACNVIETHAHKGDFKEWRYLSAERNTLSPPKPVPQCDSNYASKARI
jgi:hypothetical protein